MRAWTVLVGLMALTGCEEQSSKITVGATGGAEECALQLTGLAGSEWVFLRANPDKSETPDYKTRLKFYDEGGKLKAKYNVGSISSMYSYGCEQKGEELICREDPKVKDWCQALVAGGAECAPEVLKSYDPTLTDEQVQKGMADAEEVMKKYRDTPDWEKFKFQNNNLGNKLQGLLYIKVDQKYCRLRITDNYMTIYNGKRIEDSNPAGTNPFVKSTEGEMLWENCENATDLISLTEAEFPKDPANVGHVGTHEVGKDVQFWLLSEKTRVPEEGCTYSAEIWLDAKPWKKDYAPETVDVKKAKELRWGWSNKWDAPTLTPAVTVIVPSKTCNGKTEKLESACNAVMIK